MQQHRKLVVLLLLFQTGNIHTQESDDACRLSSEFPAPEVIPWDTKKIKVSWDKVFVNCKKKDVKTLVVKVDTDMNGVNDPFTKDAIFEDNEIILDKRPCIRHDITLKLIFFHNEKLDLLSSTNNYNKNSGPSLKSEDLYSGWLDSEVVQNICLKQETEKPTVHIPYPPEALSDCHITTGDQELELTEVPIGKDVRVEVRVENPFGKAGTISVRSIVKNIQNCTVCEMKNKFGLSARPHNSSHLNISWKDVFQGCKRFEVKKVVVKVGKEEVNTKFDKENVLVSASPCSNHSVSVEVNFKNPEKKPLKTERTTYYPTERDQCNGQEDEKGEEPSTVIWITVAILGIAGAGGAGAGVVLFLRRRSKKEEEVQDEDENPVYGLYSSDGRRKQRRITRL